jgi:hypothetical protein
LGAASVPQHGARRAKPVSSTGAKIVVMDGVTTTVKVGERQRRRPRIEIHVYAGRIVVRQDGRIAAKHPRAVRPRRRPA